MVLIYHTALASAPVASLYLHPGSRAASVLEYIFFYTPAHAIWAGREAVIVFFVLSGFVLALPMARGRTEVWRAYYPRRLVRLYLPSIASLVFAFLTTLIVARHVVPGGSEWLNQHVGRTGIEQVIFGSSLMGGAGGLNTPLWSLRWEVLFSLMLPLCLVVGRLGRSLAWTAFGFLLAMIAVGSTGVADGALAYLPIFFLGVLIAYYAKEIRAYLLGLNRVMRLAGVVVAAVLLSNVLILSPLSVEAFRPVSAVLQALGASLLVAFIGFLPEAAKPFNNKVVQWLGAVSFSLYLTHEPVVVAVAFAAGGHAPLWLLYLIVIPVALLVAALFHRVIERPSHMLSKFVDARIKARTEHLESVSASR